MISVCILLLIGDGVCKSDEHKLYTFTGWSNHTEQFSNLTLFDVCFGISVSVYLFRFHLLERNGLAY